MRITDLQLYQYRNHSRLSFKPEDGLQCIQGPNAVGKTNILEAIYLTLAGDYLRMATEKDLIQEGADRAQISLRLEEGYRHYDLVVRLYQNKNKELFLNDEKVKSIREWAPLFPVTAFTPDDLRIAKEGPQFRRKLMDQILARTSQTYMDALYQYKKYIVHRNALLKQQNTAHFMAQLNAVDYQMIQLGTVLIQQRKQLEKELQEKATRIHQELTDGTERLTLTYEADIPFHADNDAQKKAWVDALSGHLEKDLQYKNTGRGPHKDELALFVDDKPLRIYGSQGQQRTAVLALKLAEAELLKEKTGKQPILLFDDIFSELDQRRQRFMKQRVEEQAFFTMTEYLPQEGLKAHVWTLEEQSVLRKESRETW